MPPVYSSIFELLVRLFTLLGYFVKYELILGLKIGFLVSRIFKWLWSSWVFWRLCFDFGNKLYIILLMVAGFFNFSLPIDLLDCLFLLFVNVLATQSHMHLTTINKDKNLENHNYMLCTLYVESLLLFFSNNFSAWVVFEW